MLVVIAVMAVAGLVALVLLQAAGLSRRFDEMLQENNVAHATLRRAAACLARGEVETRRVEHDETSIVLPNDLQDRLEEAARRGAVSVQAATRLALERGIAELDPELLELAPPTGIERSQEP